tara:strand:- start:377 stop:556 length:180 start_codon:yes stop_codon:yes gene_type:complete
MRDDSKHLSGKYRQPFTPSFNNPEIVESTDWWDDLCKKEGVKNHWKKKSSKAKSKNNEE